MITKYQRLSFFSQSNCLDYQDKVVQEKSSYECAWDLLDEGLTVFCYDEMLLENIIRKEGRKIRIICTLIRVVHKCSNMSI